MVRHFIDNVIHAPMDSVEVTGCPKKCTETCYRITKTENPVMNNTVQFYFYFKDNDYLISEETDMYDVNAIVAGVGGSLGLFLAFSCRGFLIGLVERVATKSFCRQTDNI